MRPIIGITSRHDREKNWMNLPDAYVKAVQRNGGTPIILPPHEEIDIDQHISLIDGLIISGGPDVDPMLYEEQPKPKQGSISPLRDEYEIKLVKQALDVDKTIFAICRGAQVLNVALGGTLIQDTDSQVKDPVKHRQEAPASYGTHTVWLRENSKIRKIFCKEKIITNSFHHQAVKEPGEDVVPTGWASDDVVEAFEVEGKSYVLAVQWHPEHMDNEMNKLFKAMIEEVSK